MKSKQLFPVLMLSLLLGGCINIDPTNSQNSNTSESDIITDLDSNEKLSSNKENVSNSNKEEIILKKYSNTTRGFMQYFAY